LEKKRPEREAHSVEVKNVWSYDSISAYPPRRGI